jgi:hypothetical protein
MAPSSVITVPGIYLYGGKRNLFKPPPSALYVLKTGQKRLSWIKLEVKGREKPPPRYRHTMEYSSRLNSLVIFGGVGANGLPLKDLWFFHLDALFW